MQSHNGALAERLGTGLQNLGQRFDSARHLKMKDRALSPVFRFEGLRPYYSLRGVPLKLPELATLGTRKIIPRTKEAL